MKRPFDSKLAACCNAFASCVSRALRLVESAWATAGERDVCCMQVGGGAELPGLHSRLQHELRELLTVMDWRDGTRSAGTAEESGPATALPQPRVVKAACRQKDAVFVGGAMGAASSYFSDLSQQAKYIQSGGCVPGPGFERTRAAGTHPQTTQANGHTLHCMSF